MQTPPIEQGPRRPRVSHIQFRNVLVHEYAEVDDSRVVANLALLDDLEAFASQLGGWASRQ